VAAAMQSFAISTVGNSLDYVTEYYSAQVAASPVGECDSAASSAERTTEMQSSIGEHLCTVAQAC